MKISHLAGISIAVIALVAVIGLTQSAVDDSQNKIRVAFFPSIVLLFRLLEWKIKPLQKILMMT